MPKRIASMRFIWACCSRSSRVRLFAPCRWWDEGHQHQQQGYFEIARPQVHGYELNTICAIPSTPFKFATGAQEKVLRIFDAPQQFICDLASLSMDYKASDAADYEERPMSAAVPELGLSNKAQGHIDSTLVKRLQPPGEAALMQDTLWPELSKLYGHGYEIFCVASSNSGSILASASASKDKLHSSIRLWDSRLYKQTQVLEVHGLTVVEMRFSRSDRFLLSVSRDRSIAVCERGADGFYSLQWLLPKAHARIVWTCSWTHDERLFATGSRDKKVKVWRASGAQWQLDSSFAMSSAVTCVRFLPSLAGADYVLAVALESGLIYIQTADSRADKELQWASTTQVPDRMCPSGRVRDMEWKPLELLVEGATAPQTKFSLAVAGDDSSVRIFDINLPAI